MRHSRVFMIAFLTATLLLYVQTENISMHTFIEGGKKRVLLKGSGNINIMAIVPLWGDEYSLNYETGIIPLLALEYFLPEAIADMSNTVAQTIPNRPDLLDGVYGFNLNLKDVYYQDSNDKRDAVRLHRKVTERRADDEPYTYLLGPRSSIDVAHLEFVRYKLFSPLFSYGASSIYFDADSLNWQNEVISAVPSDVFRVRAVIDLLLKYGWRYVGGVYSRDLEGEFEFNYFKREIKDLDICVPFSINVFVSLTAADDLAKNLKIMSEDRAIKVIVLFTNDLDSRAVLKALKRENLVNRFILLFVYGSINYVEVVRGYEDVAVGSVAIDFNSEDIPSFDTWLLSLNPNISQSVHFHLYWEDLFQCRLPESKPLKDMKPPKRKFHPKNCTGNEVMEKYKGVYPMSLNRRMTRLMFDVLRELPSLIKHFCTVACVDNLCSNWNESCPFPFNFETSDRVQRAVIQLISEKRYNAKFLKYTDKKGDFFYYELLSFKHHDGQMQTVFSGYWQFMLRDDLVLPLEPKQLLETYTPEWVIRSTPHWVNSTDRYPPTSVCSAPCEPGYIMEPLATVLGENTVGNKMCCWKCIKCPANSILKNKFTCRSCMFDEFADLSNNSCKPLPEYVLSIGPYSSIFVIVMLCLSCAGICFTLFVVAVFIKFDGHKVVRAAGRDLSYGILVGLFGLFLCPFLYLRKPSETSCGLQSMVPFVSFLTCYAALFMKVLRIYRIFLRATRKNIRPHFITPSSQIFVLFFVVVLQSLITSVWFLNDVPGSEKIVSEHKQFVTIHCKGSQNYAKYIVNLLPSFIAQIACTILAAKTRKLPRNFNEAKYIAFTLYFTGFCWCLFFSCLGYQTSHDTYLKECSLSVLTCAVSYITLAGLFGQKLWLVIVKRDAASFEETSSSRRRSVSSSNPEIVGGGSFINSSENTGSPCNYLPENQD